MVRFAALLLWGAPFSTADHLRLFIPPLNICSPASMLGNPGVPSAICGQINSKFIKLSARSLSEWSSQTVLRTAGNVVCFSAIVVARLLLQPRTKDIELAWVKACECTSFVQHYSSPGPHWFVCKTQDNCMNFCKEKFYQDLWSLDMFYVFSWANRIFKNIMWKIEVV